MKHEFIDFNWGKRFSKSVLKFFERSEKNASLFLFSPFSLKGIRYLGIALCNAYFSPYFRQIAIFLDYFANHPNYLDFQCSIIDKWTCEYRFSSFSRLIGFPIR